MNIKPIPADWLILSPCCHPRDGEPGTAVRLPSNVELFVCGDGRAVRALPTDWRDRPADACGLRIAACFTDQLRQAQAMAAGIGILEEWPGQ